MAAELWQFIQEEHAVVRQRHLARQRHAAPADPPHVGDGVMQGAARASRDQGRAVTRQAGDAVDARGLNSFGQSQRRQDGGQPMPRLYASFAASGRQLGWESA
jgi:hypothetical protein